MSNARRWLFGVCAAGLLLAPLAGQSGVAQPGDPLPGITPNEFAQFRLGLTTFAEVEGVEDGLGPAFNGTSCAACHNAPVIGGITPMTEIRAAPVARRHLALDASGSTLFQLFSLPNHLPARASSGGRTSWRAACRCRSSAPGSSRRFPAKRSWRWPSARSQRRRRAGPRVGHHRRGHRPAAGRAVRLEGADRHAPDLRRRRLSQRDGDHERRVSDRARLRHPGRSAQALRRDAGSRGQGRPVDRAARYRQLRVVHALPGADRARSHRRHRARRRARVRGHWLRRLPHAGADHGPASARSSTGGVVPCSPISCSTTSGRRRRSRTTPPRRGRDRTPAL